MIGWISACKYDHKFKNVCVIKFDPLLLFALHFPIFRSKTYKLSSNHEFGGSPVTVCQIDNKLLVLYF